MLRIASCNAQSHIFAEYAKLDSVILIQRGRWGPLFHAYCSYFDFTGTFFVFSIADTVFGKVT